jgi:hypothetical protein
MVLDTGARVTPGARAFIDGWLDTAVAAPSVSTVDTPATRQMIHLRERVLKRGLARLDNPRALDTWRGDSGLRQLNYRWNPVVRKIIDDIVTGLAA